jgi:hypothetical protein
MDSSSWIYEVRSTSLYFCTGCSWSIKIWTVKISGLVPSGERYDTFCSALERVRQASRLIHCLQDDVLLFPVVKERKVSCCIRKVSICVSNFRHFLGAADVRTYWTPVIIRHQLVTCLNNGPSLRVTRTEQVPVPCGTFHPWDSEFEPLHIACLRTLCKFITS